MGSTSRYSDRQAGGVGRRLLPALLVLALCGSLLPDPVQAQPDRSQAGAPLLFVENVGQFEPAARFQIQGAGGSMWLTADGLWLTFLETTEEPATEPARPPGRLPEAGARAPAQARQGVSLKLSFAGANRRAKLEPFGRQPAHVSYLKGSDPAAWRTAVPVWQGVRYRDLYPGVDLELSGATGQLAWRWVVTDAAGRAALPDARLRVAGGDALAVADGRLRIATALGEVALALPAAPADSGPAPARPVVLTASEEMAPFGPGGDTAGARTPTAATSSQLLYSTFLGGRHADRAHAMAVDGSGAVYVAGFTSSDDFPTTPGAFRTTSQRIDAFVTKLNPTGGGLVYSTFLGGSGDEAAHTIAVDGSGAVYVAGYTDSADFPTTASAYDRSHNGGGLLGDAFVTKLDPAGGGLVYGTFLGGSGGEAAVAIAVDSGGAAYVAGKAASPNFPTTGAAYDRFCDGCGGTGGAGDAFVTKLNPAGSDLVYSTFLGGSRDDRAYAIAVDGSGAVAVAGGTSSTNFPTTPGAFQTAAGGGGSAFVTRLDPAGRALIYSTFLGGSDGEEAYAVAVDGGGEVVVAGQTWSSDFPTTPGAYDTSFNGNGDAFVTRLNAVGSGLVSSTFLGGSAHNGGLPLGSDIAYALALDGSGAIYVTGGTNSADFPTTADAFDPSFNGGLLGDAFVARLNPAGSALAYSTFLGGADRRTVLVTGSDTAYAVAVDGSGAVYVAGSTNSGDFPTTPGAFDQSANGEEDAFVARLMPPTSPPLAPPAVSPPIAVDDGHIAIGATAPRTDWYFAEGYTGEKFEEYLTIQNPSSTSIAVITITYYLQGAAAQVKTLAVDPNSRTTVAVHKSAFGVGRNQAVSARVSASQPVIVERVIYFLYNGGIDGGHTALGAAAPAPVWYFAEGFTGAGFQQYLTIQNPNGQAADVQVTYYLEGGGTVVKRLTAPASGRTTIAVHDAAAPGGLGANQANSARVESSNGVAIVVERSTYFTYTGQAGGPGTVDGGHNAVGATALGRTWYFAEGFTSPGFDQYVTIQNPTSQAGTATITYFVENAGPQTRTVPLPPTSRTTVPVHAPQSDGNPGGYGRTQPGQGLSTRVETSVDTIVERSMYFTYNGSIDGGHNAVGATTPASTWYFAEGYTGPGFDQYVTIQNPNNRAGTATLVYSVEGRPEVLHEVPLPANSRVTVRVHDTTSPGGLGRLATGVGNALTVTTDDLPVVVERAMYFVYPSTFAD